MAYELSKDEEIFVKRMVPHVEAGMTFEEAAQAVIEDDQRIFNAFVDKSTTGDVMAEAITSAVYHSLRKK